MILLGFYLLAAMILLPGAILVAWAHPRIALLALGVLTLTASDATPVPLFNILSTAVFPPDILAIVLAGAAVLRGARLRRNLQGLGVAALILLVLFSCNLVFGISTFGTGAIVQARPTIYLLAGGAYFLSLDLPELKDSILRYTVWVGVALAVLGAWRWQTRGLGAADELFQAADGSFQITRIMIAPQAFVVACGALISLWKWTEGRRRGDAILTSVLFATVALAQHRTVWAATIGALVVMLVFARPDLRRRLALVGVGAAIVIAPLVAGGVLSPILSHLGKSASTASLGSGTFGWREQGWGQLIQTSKGRGAPTVLFGDDFGQSTNRIINDHLVTVSAHSFYVSTFLRAGLVGLFVLMLFIGRWLRRRGQPLMLAFGVAIGLYGVAYSVDFLVAPIVALLLSGPEFLAGPIGFPTTKVQVARGLAHAPVVDVRPAPNGPVIAPSGIPVA
jgi:hypothetical protein